MSLRCPYNNALECSLDNRNAEILRQVQDAQYLGEFRADYVGPIAAQCVAWPEKCWRLQEFLQKQKQR